MGVMKLLFGGMSNQKDTARKAELYRNLIRREAQIGGELFGPVPKGGKREFFCLDRHTWIWHEEWPENGRTRTKTTRYDVRPNGVLKAQDGQQYSYITREEADHLVEAAKLYRHRVRTELYKLPA